MCLSSFLTQTTTIRLQFAVTSICAVRGKSNSMYFIIIIFKLSIFKILMRCFIAIDLPQKAKEKLAEIIEKLPKEISRFKTVEKENLHLTLKFLGEINDYKVNWVIQQLKNLNIKKFKIYTAGIGFFPNENFIRVLWIGLEPQELIKKIHKKIDNALEKYFKKDKQFESHITLARIKSVKNREKFIEEVKKIKVPKIEFEVSEIKLKRSVLTKEGPIYSDLYVLRFK